MSLSNPPPKKRASKKAVPEWQKWERTKLDRRFYIITGILALVALAALAAVGSAFYNGLVQRHNAADKRATVTNDGTPQLIGPFTCDLKTGFHAGSVHTFIRNVGNVPAANIGQTFSLHLVPERKVGNPEFDDVPTGDCKSRPREAAGTMGLAVGDGADPRLQIPRTAVPPLLENETSQMFGQSCIYYSDKETGDHATCDVYRFRLADGATVFMCDGKAEAGAFDDRPEENCAN